MQKLPINVVEPGMVLAKPVINEKGMTLCAEGTELTETLIERLRVMNIMTLTVKGHPVDTGAPVKTLEDRLQELKGRFALVEGDPIMDRIREAIAEAIEVQAREDLAQEAGEQEATHE